MSELLRGLQRVIKECGDRPALVLNEHEVSYARFGEAVLRLAKGLVDVGVRPGDRIALILPNVVQFPISYYAVLAVGATVVPVNITYKEREIRYILEDAEVKGVIAWEGFRNTLAKASDGLPQCSLFVYLGKRIPRQSYSLTSLQVRSVPLEEPVERGEDEVAVILYTAGTTGRPMGAELTHANLSASAQLLSDLFGFGVGDRILAVVPLFHSFGQAVGMNAPLLHGATVVLEPKFEATRLVETLRDKAPRWLVAVPTMLKQLLDACPGDSAPSGLRFCITSGSPISGEVVSLFEERFGARVLPGYGLTETFSLVACTRPDREWRPGSVGQPLYGLDVAVWGEDGQVLPPSRVGEIVVKGPTVMKGYLNRPKATEEVKAGGWLHTGDVGYFDEDGYLFLVDRKKDVIIKGGFSIFPSEVEQCLQAHPKVERAVVIGVPDEEQGEEVKAFVLLKAGEVASAQELIDYCRERMALYKCPKYVEFCSSLPRTPTGRVLKRMLREREVKAGRSSCEDLLSER
ncbi:MAG: long-chain fatty acid--CoA ligase [candidate division KSB1 bacterium]|nr:long-chain fatty acid--CoA ligase [candidate division KSB1 bacterium]